MNILPKIIENVTKNFHQTAKKYDLSDILLGQVNKDFNNYINIIKFIDDLSYSFSTDLYKNIIIEIEEQFFKSDYRKRYCEVIKTDPRNIWTLFGEVAFERRYYYDNFRNEYYYFVDKILMFPKNLSFDPFVCAKVCEVASIVDSDIYIVVNGDEPLITASQIEKCIPDSIEPDGVYVSNLMTAFKNPVDVVDPTNLKIVTNKNGIGLFISRSPIPFPRGKTDYVYNKFLGVSAFSKKALEYYSNTPQGPIEAIEENDSFRFIENRLDVHYISVESESVSVDTPKDLERVREILSKN